MKGLKIFSKQFPFYSNGIESNSPGNTSQNSKPQNEKEAEF